MRNLFRSHLIHGVQRDYGVKLGSFVGVCIAQGHDRGFPSRHGPAGPARLCLTGRVSLPLRGARRGTAPDPVCFALHSDPIGMRSFLPAALGSPDPH